MSSSQNNKVLPVGIVPEMKESYLDYAMSVIVSRALPDVRDGLKPVHRRILYAMHEMGLSAASKPRKSAAVVGEVLGKYHPHGDAAVYESMVKMAQEFSLRYPLVLGQGNFGSVDGDSAAAMRYTEAKMSRLAEEMLSDIGRQTVEFRPNYDNTKEEPSILPAAVPNLLLNGSLGIAVGMATKIPPHNLGEVVDALVYLIDNPSAATEELLQFVKGPDFPTGGIIFNERDIHHAYATGRGGVVMRGEAEVVEGKSGQFQITISSLPYQVNKAELIVKIADLVHEKKLEGIRDIRDQSTRDIRVVIDIKQGAHPQKILNYLYKHTDLETSFNFNTLALVGGIPKILSLKAILEQFIGFRREVVTRRTQFDLKRGEEREHILLGLKSALDHIDEIIKLIKKSPDTDAARAALMKSFKFSEMQANAILEMKLRQLANLERQKIEDELRDKQVLIAELKSILASPSKLMRVIKGELADIHKKYADERRTKVIKGAAREISHEDLVPEKEDVLTLTAGGYLKRTDPSDYRKQRRGGVGVIDLDTKEEDFINIFLTANTHSDLLFFTDRGKVYSMKMYEVPEGKRATRGKSVMNFLSLEAGERVTSVLAMPKSLKGQKLSIMMVTQRGVAKKVAAASFEDVRRSGIIAIKLQKGDHLLSTMFVEKGNEAILVSSRGQSIRFKESDIREMGRAAGGVRAMRLKKDDMIVGAEVVKRGDTSELLVLSSNGFGKKTNLKEFKIQKRGGSGVKCAKVTPKTGPLMVSRVLTEENEEIVAISKRAQVIRTEIKQIPSLGRQTQGVRVMKLREGDSIASLTCL